MLLQVDLPWAVFGLVADEAGVVTRAAPIASFTVGWHVTDVVAYYVGRGGKVEQIWQSS